MNEFENAIRDLAVKVAPLIREEKFDEALGLIRKVRNYAIILLSAIREQAEGKVPQADIDHMVATVQALDRGVVEMEQMIEKVKNLRPSA